MQRTLPFEEHERRLAAKDQRLRLKSSLLGNARATPKVKAVMLAIFQFPTERSRTDRIYLCSKGDLARAMRLDDTRSNRRQIQRWTEKAIALGFLVREPGFRRDGSQEANRFRFLWGRLLRSATACPVGAAPRGEDRREGRRRTPGVPGRRARAPTSVAPPATLFATSVAPPATTTCHDPPDHSLKNHPYIETTDGGMDAVCVGGKADAAEAPFRPVRTAPSGRTRNAWGGWDAPVTIERLTSFRSVSALYAEAVRKRWIAASEVNAEQFFALARACRRKGKDPAKFFTHCLREQLWDVIAHEDQQAALDAFDKFGRPEPRS